MRVLYIDIDSLRPDHLGCYGYPRNTSPVIDSLCAQGTKFTNMYTSDAPCMPSRTAFYSGRFGFQTGVVGHGYSAAETRRETTDRRFKDRFYESSMASKLKNGGYYTAMISPFGERHAAWWYYAGFNEIHNTGKCGMESAEEVMPVVEDWLKRRGKEDTWYLHVNFWDPHTPYRVPTEYGNPFENESLPQWLTQEVLDRHKNMTGPHSPKDLDMYTSWDPKVWPRMPEQIDDLASLKQWIDGYDTAVRYVDDHVGKMLEVLRAQGVLDDTLIIISADHGENQGELGIYGEHATADQGTCHIPYIVSIPGVDQPALNTDLHYHLDTAPTLVDVLNALEHRGTGASGSKPLLLKSDLWSGDSFAPVLLPGLDYSDYNPRPYLVVSQVAHVAQRSVRFGSFLYIRTYHDGFHLFPKQMLFNLDDDPYEEHNLASVLPELCQRAASLLLDWQDEQLMILTRTATSNYDPLWLTLLQGGPAHALHNPRESQLLPYLERLEQTGRAEGAELLRQKYGVTGRL